MREIRPYKTRAGLEKAIDNGGRFYNFFSVAQDKVVTTGELAKAAGVLSSDQVAFLFLELAAHELDKADREQVVGRPPGKPGRNETSGQPKQPTSQAP